jgi:hypothetical protein
MAHLARRFAVEAVGKDGAAADPIDLQRRKAEVGVGHGA